MLARCRFYHYINYFFIVFAYSKRTISEVQLMHNVQEHKQVSQRQDWLQAKLRDITVPTHDKGQHHGQTRKIRDIFQHLYAEPQK
jgi:hypothetical protein